ncbi:MAG: TRAP transporter small permease subunit [Pseudomonadota bacterium]
MKTSEDETRAAGLLGLAVRLTTAWAILGGAVLIAVVAVNVGSILGVIVGLGAVPGDFELTEMGVAVAAFAFLPYCQATGKNVAADIFTAGASPRWLARFETLASSAALFFGALLLWRMSLGMLDQRAYDYVTTILQVPVWWGYAASLISLALLVFAALATLLDALGRAVRG